MTDKFPLIIAKVERAKKHIEDLHTTLEAFWDSVPNRVRFEDNPNTGERTYYLVSVAEIPLNVVLIIGDALHNLRSALDHLAYQLPLAPGKTQRWTQFPIVESPAKYMSSKIRRKIQFMRKDVVKAMDALEPYKGGNDPLWHLHKLNSIDKHRLLITACVTNDARSMTPTERALAIKGFMGGYPGHAIPDLRGTLRAIVPVPLKAGDKLFTILQSELEQDMKVHFDVAFNEPQIIECKSVIVGLHEMAKTVGKIVLEFDSFLV